jgi:hypothetical protein
MISKRLQSWLRQILTASRQELRPERRRFRPRVESLEDRELLAVFLVTSALNGVAGGGDGTLRAAILASNASPGPSPNIIEFDLEPGGAQTINLTSPLPTLANPVTIDGTSQPGWNAAPLITLNGAGLPSGNGFNGLTATANGCTIKGLVVENFGHAGISLYSTNNVVTDNWVEDNGSIGVGIANAVSGNIIGGTTLRTRNVISGNTNYGVEISEYCTSNVVEGNYIGTDSTGTTAGAAQNIGVGIDNNSTNNTVGGTAPGAGNLISGNFDGVYINTTANDNKVLGNLVGTTASGTVALANTDDGIRIQSSNNTVGGTLAGAGNLISGNTVDGVIIAAGASGNELLGNMIGTTVAGNASLPNGNDGVHVEGSDNVVGMITPGAGNVIAFNQLDGVQVSDAIGDGIHGNSIFANSHLGIELDSANNSQAAPTLASAIFNPTTRLLTVHGTLTSTASTVFTLAFFANPVPVAPLVAQGQLFLEGGFVATTTAAGSAPFTFAVSVPAAFSTATTPLITATATLPLIATTNPIGDTSQFSAGVPDPVLSRPAFTSAKTAAFTVNTHGSFTVTTSGLPAPTLIESGTLPKGLTFNRDTGVLSGTPAAGTSGSYLLHFTAKNDTGAAVAQTVTLTINKLIRQVAIPSQASIAAPAKVTALGHDRFEAVYTLTESASSSLAGRIQIAGFATLPPGVKFEGSTAAVFPAKSKMLTLAAVFTNTTKTSLASLLAGLSPVVDEIIV